MPLTHHTGKYIATTIHRCVVGANRKHLEIKMAVHSPVECRLCHQVKKGNLSCSLPPRPKTRPKEKKQKQLLLPASKRVPHKSLVVTQCLHNDGPYPRPQRSSCIRKYTNDECCPNMMITHERSTCDHANQEQRVFPLGKESSYVRVKDYGRLPPPNMYFPLAMRTTRKVKCPKTWHARNNL